MSDQPIVTCESLSTPHPLVSGVHGCVGWTIAPVRERFEAPPQRPRYHQRAKVMLDPMMLAHLLDLPEGMRVVHVYATPDPTGIAVLVEGPSIKPTPVDTESPMLRGGVAREQFVVGGKTYVRWEWNG